MKRYIIFLPILLMAVVFVSGCVQLPEFKPKVDTNEFINPDMTPSSTEEYVTIVQAFANHTLPLEVAKLPPLELSTVDSFEKYKKFVDGTNSLIEILNKETDIFNIPRLEATQESWKKTLNFIEEYSPLLNNYNEVIKSAKEYEKSQTEKNLQKFYLKSGTFGFEIGIIVGSVFYSTSYEMVGIVYRSVGLNRLAFKCSTCVSVILSEAHWTVRTVLVEGSSKGAEKLIEEITKLYNSGAFEEINNNLQTWVNSTYNIIMSNLSEVT